MNKVEKNQEITFLIKGIELVDFSLGIPENPIQDIKTFNFNIKVEQKISFEHKLILVVTSVEILDELKITILGSIKVSVIFELTNFDDFIDKKNNKRLDLPDELVLTFNSIGISTTRGVMFSQFKGTFLHNAFLPAIDHKQLSVEAKNK